MLVPRALQDAEAHGLLADGGGAQGEPGHEAGGGRELGWREP